VAVHDWLGVALIIVAAIGAVAAIIGIFLPRVIPAVRVFARFLVAAFGLQVLVGLLLVVTGHRPQEGLHWLYGAAALLALPFAMYMGGPLRDRDKRLWLAAGAVATFLFALRAMMTG
jgi:hypothetical protein